MAKLRFQCEGCLLLASSPHGPLTACLLWAVLRAQRRKQTGQRAHLQELMVQQACRSQPHQAESAKYPDVM